jgi:hypothetical protein
MSDDIITSDDIKTASNMQPLGPHYFSSRRFAEEVLKDVETTTFAEILKKVSDDLYSSLLEKTEIWLLSDAEVNVQGHIWRTVDQIVRGILSGEKWIVDRYALGSKYDCAPAREVIARHVPKELQDARIADLEEEIKQLNETIKYLRVR